MSHHSILKISSILILLIAFLCFFTAIFIKYFYFDEEILDIPIVESDYQNIKTVPETFFKKNDNENIEIEILSDKNHNDIEQRLIVNDNKPELLPFNVNKKENDKNEKFISKHYPLKPVDKKSEKNKKLSTLNNLVRYRVQLGSFKDKDRAIKALKNTLLIHAKYFSNIKLEIYTLKKDNYFIHRVWTVLMKKKQALDLCNNLRNNNINCILQVEKK